MAGKLSSWDLRRLNESLKDSGLKFCNQCSTEKLISEFKVRRHDGRIDGECLECSRKRNAADRALRRAKVQKPVGEVDPFVVDSLVQRYPVPEATRDEVNAAARIFYDRGLSYDEIAVLLRISKREAERAVEVVWARERRAQKSAARRAS